MIYPGILERLTPHVCFEFDPATCPSYEAGRGLFVVGDVDHTRYAEFRVERYKRPSFEHPAVDGIVTEDLSDRYTDFEDDDVWDIEPRPDNAHDRTMHGLFPDNRGYIALYGEHSRLASVVFQFHVVNGPEGANNLSATLGRDPGNDIPRFISSDQRKGHHTAGQITEALAEMAQLSPTIQDFYFVTHDLGVEFSAHGISWPHTHPVIFRHLSNVAQLTVEKYPGGLHREDFDGPDSRHPNVVGVASALDGLVARLRPTIDKFAVAELRLRDGRYDKVSDQEIAIGLLRAAFASSRSMQHHRARTLLAVSGDTSESEQYRRGYWIGMQHIQGVVDTRLALHEVCPHPEADDAQTRRTLDVLRMVKAEVDRRISDNAEYALVA